MIDIPEKYRKSLAGTKFIDLFCGIGAFRLTLESLGAKCIFSSDIDEDARKTYKKNFGEYPSGDVKKVRAKDVPDHDILCAGFPCQAFSTAGSRAKTRGFDNPRGTLFFEVVRIAAKKKPKMLFLENVENLKNHDGGRTYKVILSNLERIGYDVFARVLNASYYGVPQARKRIYFVCFRKDLKARRFSFPKKTDIFVSLWDVLTDEAGNWIRRFKPEEYVLNGRSPMRDMLGRFPRRIVNIGTLLVKEKSRKRRGQSAHIYDSKGHAATQMANDGNTRNGMSSTGTYLVRKMKGMSKNVYDADGHARTQLSDMGWRKDGLNVSGTYLIRGRKMKGMNSKIYDARGHARTIVTGDKSFTINRGDSTGLYNTGEVVRSLTPRESMRCQGFPDWYKIRKQPRIAYKQAGNSIVVNVLQYIMLEVVKGGYLK